MKTQFRTAILALTLLAAFGCSERVQRLKTSCPPGQENCDGQCVDLTNHADNCGACGRVCPGDMVCSEGSCAVGCASELTLCGRACVDTGRDDQNCGGCSFACAPGISCQAGRCSCPDEKTACDGVCTDLDADPENCGACEKSCAGGLCADGACTCLEGWTSCNGSCVNLNEDSAHCGECGRACGEGSACTGGTCPCPGGLTDCGGELGCVDTQKDTANCGACGNDCGSAPCLGGTCFCAPGTAFCDGECVNVETDHQNCGECGRSCENRPNSSQGICGAGDCYFACNDGFDDCDRDPVTGCEARLLDDVHHCGACNHDCKSLPNTQSTQCKDSTCTFTCKTGWDNCDGDPNNGCETNLLTSAPHCGGCGMVCEGPCASGKCSEPVQISAGGMHNCATTVDGSVYCWGSNARGQSGSDAVDAFLATRVPGLAPVQEVEAGGYFTCALLRSGEVACWGDGKYGQLGDGEMTSRSTPTKVPALNQVVQVSTSGATACALRSSGELVCWGENAHGQLGDGTTQNAVRPVRVSLGAEVPSRVFAGSTTCAQTKSKKVMCWGQNHAGQVGDGTTENRLSPFLIPNLNNVKLLHMGHSNHTACVILESGEVKCWGSNGQGAVGDGTKENRSAPTKVLGLEGEVVVGLGGGASHSCAHFASGKAKCWGYNSTGQVGNGLHGNGQQELLPVDVVDLEGVQQMDGGNWHTCALLTGGKLRCWGHNVYGQLAYPNPSERLYREVPVPVRWK